MKKNEVKIGGVYSAKVSDKITGVRIMKANPNGGWDAVNLATKKTVRIKSAARLRGPWNPRQKKTDATSASVAKKNAKASKDTKKPKKADTGERGAKQAQRPGGLDAAVKVLKEVGEPLSCKAMVNIMLEKGYWQTQGKTPAATIYAAIIRESATAVQKAKKSRFRKVGRGQFTLNT